MTSPEWPAYEVPPRPASAWPPMTAPVPPPPPRRPSRRHPADGARILALVTSIGATGVIGAAMVIGDRPAGTVTAVATVPTSAVAGSAGTTPATPATSATKAAGAAYKDGVFTGAAEYTKWGDVQVQVTIANGKVTAVKTLQSPTDRKSARINAQAQPVLEQEAIAAQSATIDMVSGATYTSTTYKQSLQAALDLAAGRAASTP
jgi:uncharacterized protein with FMN-binding domain